jgi:hypothetical protein
MHVLAYLGIVLLTSVGLAQPSDSVGRVVALAGQATVQHKGQAQTEPLMMQSLLHRDDFIRTQASSKVRIALVDGTTLALGEQSTLYIGDVVQSSEQRSRTTWLTMVEGIFRLVVDKVLPGSTFEVHTTNAVAAVRGTDWLGQVTGETTAIVVLQGEVAVKQARLEVRETVLLSAGMGTDVIGPQAPTPAKQWGAARVQALVQATTLP